MTKSVKETKEQVPGDAESLVERVRERYGRIASGQESGCCGATVDGPAEEVLSRGIGYDATQLGSVPKEANLGLGCGAPIAHLALQRGETLLDLGSGGGLDALLAAPLVGPTGHVIGVDMTPEMIERARVAATEVGASQVEFRHGRLEQLPVDDASVDAVTSNCVINLVPDKSAVFREVARVLRPGGRLVISDILLDGDLPPEVTRDLLAYVGCVAGAMRRPVYLELVRKAGLGEIEVLRDVDYLESVIDALPQEIAGIMERTGVEPEQLAGVVRSVTFRARKPA